MKFLIFINKLKHKFIQNFYWPICRLYARYLGDSPANNIYNFLCSIAFFLMHRYWPNLKRPLSFSEKIFFRMLYDRRPLLTIISDKLTARDFVAEKIGHHYLVPIHWSGTQPTDIPYDHLPSKFVIKANHGCGYIILVKNKDKIARKEVNRLTSLWLRTNFCTDQFIGSEWAYKNIKPKLFIEEYIEEEGNPPKDYKFFCFSGRVEYILITYDRFGYHREKHFSRNFDPLDLWNGADQYPGPFIKPKNLDEMIRIAEQLSSEFDFIRVDLYNVEGKIYFGELTCYPAGGSAPFVPRKWDYIFGEKWKMSRIEK